MGVPNATVGDAIVGATAGGGLVGATVGVTVGGRLVAGTGAALAIGGAKEFGNGAGIGAQATTKIVAKMSTMIGLYRPAIVSLPEEAFSNGKIKGRIAGR